MYEKLWWPPLSIAAATITWLDPTLFSEHPFFWRVCTIAWFSISNNMSLHDTKDYSKLLELSKWDIDMKLKEEKKELEIRTLKWLIGKWRFSQCWNLMIFLLLRFYVKSILRILEVQNLPFWHILRLWILIFWCILAFKKCKNG